MPLKRVVDFESALLRYMNEENVGLLGRINENGGFDDDIAQALKQALDTFKARPVY